MRISKAVTPILEALGAPASKFAGKSLSKLITAVSPYVIDFINDAKGGLPEVTADDNGKVLGVVDGAWGKADAPSGNNDFVVTFDYDGTSYSVDKTRAEIEAALAAGLFVYGVVKDVGNIVNQLAFESLGTNLTFGVVSTNQHKLFKINPINQLSVETITYAIQS